MEAKRCASIASEASKSTIPVHIQISGLLPRVLALFFGRRTRLLQFIEGSELLSHYSHSRLRGARHFESAVGGAGGRARSYSGRGTPSGEDPCAELVAWDPPRFLARSALTPRPGEQKVELRCVTSDWVGL